MSSEHEAAHEPLLAAVLRGECDAVPQELEECPFCADRLLQRRAAVAALDSAGAEYRAVSAAAHASGDAIDDRRVASLVREGLGIPGTRRHGQWQWWLLAALFVAGAVLAWPRAHQVPADRTLGSNQTYSPTGSNIAPAGLRFSWPAEPGSKYRLLLHEADAELLPWDTILCGEPTWQPDPEYLGRMRSLRSDWSWVVESVRDSPAAGEPATRRSKRQYFSFSR